MARTRLQCVPWDAAGIRPKTTFTGNLSADHVAGKILVASNTLDPRYAGAVLLVQDAPGHTITLSMGKCAQQAIGAFFQAGVLPTAGTVCQPDQLPLIGAVTSGPTSGTATSGGVAQTSISTTSSASRRARLFSDYLF
ncbi:hypothetical protein EXIGLDRAFT_701468 [Exidia glandulosa HHB12029]|uniref:Peptidase S33 tripeptidyl aminopeptidase-like C-terminal domain-containing protein n=1 Tax=Exidia glandulosa HHB12029 TaxID=1314781 RepID=A0A165CY30_EXIGL|nr:hypothetical protein EXIGLDRAFT_701468 [Exidia glandulosa HHB12029]